jgi:hypothetical protein
LAALELDLGPVVTRQDEDAYIFANPRTGKRDTPAGPMEKHARRRKTACLRRPDGGYFEHRNPGR